MRVRPDGAEEALLAAPTASPSAAEIEVSAARDPENQPLTHALPGQLRPVPRVKTLRRALALTQEEFAERYRIPLGTLRDWEQGRSEPDQPAKSYLTVIAGDPEGVARTLREFEHLSGQGHSRGWRWDRDEIHSGHDRVRS